jgi:hypothetical protein
LNRRTRGGNNERVPTRSRWASLTLRRAFAVQEATPVTRQRYRPSACLGPRSTFASDIRNCVGFPFEHWQGQQLALGSYLSRGASGAIDLAEQMARRRVRYTHVTHRRAGEPEIKSL